MLIHINANYYAMVNLILYIYKNKHWDLQLNATASKINILSLWDIIYTIGECILYWSQKSELVVVDRLVLSIKISSNVPIVISFLNRCRD